MTPLACSVVVKCSSRHDKKNYDGRLCCGVAVEVAVVVAVVVVVVFGVIEQSM